MKPKIPIQELVLAALFGALGLVLPIFFHALGLGSVFLPMFLPLLTLGFMVSVPTAVAVGLMTPIISSLLTGMPPIVPPIAPIMSVEAAAMAGLASWLYHNLRVNFWICLIGGILAGRLVLLLAVLFVAPLLGLPGEVLSISAVIIGLPGIVLQLVMVPALVKLLENKFASYPKKDCPMKNNIRNNRETRQYFNRVAQEWANKPLEDDRLIDLITSLNLTEGQVILDIGCGAGRLSRAVLKAVNHNGLVVGLDIAEKMVKTAHQKNLAPNLFYLCGEVEHLPLPPNFCHQVFCLAAFPHFENQYQALQEIHQVLKPQGYLTIFHLLSRQEVNSRHQEIGGPLVSHILPDLEEIQNLLQKAGFGVLETVDRPGLYWVRARKVVQ
ncbi:MAG: class I SAM-dependent methyltransferase [candidate division KSB1 bacterium]|nr:class I SAM-dependent methyltransferase [candidate division KSB1 bacterium]